MADRKIKELLELLLIEYKKESHGYGLCHLITRLFYHTEEMTLSEWRCLKSYIKEELQRKVNIYSRYYISLEETLTQKIDTDSELLYGYVFPPKDKKSRIKWLENEIKNV